MCRKRNPRTCCCRCLVPAKQDDYLFSLFPKTTSIAVGLEARSSRITVKSSAKSLQLPPPRVLLYVIADPLARAKNIHAGLFSGSSTQAAMRIG